MDQIRSDLQRLPIVGFSAAFLVVMMVIAELSGVNIAYSTFKPMGYVAIVLTVTWLYTSFRRMPRFQASCEMILSWKLVTFGVLFFTYAAARPAYPLMDPALARADELIGFHVPTIVAWIDSNRLLSGIFEVTYHSFGLQLLLVPVALVCCGHRDTAARMLLAFAAICVISSFISIWFPAVEAFAHYGISISDLKNLTGSDGYRFHESFFGVRHDENFVLTLGMTSGIVSFPSIHAAVAILCGYVTWQIIWFRYAGLVLNTFMFLATVPVGAHYVVEVIAGTVIGVAVVWAVHRFDLSAYRRLQWSALLWQPGQLSVPSRQTA